jgi:hypothetical protein
VPIAHSGTDYLLPDYLGGCRGSDYTVPYALATIAANNPARVAPHQPFRALQCRMLGHAVATAGVFFRLASAIPQTDTAWEVRDLRKMRARIHGSV